MHRGPQIQVFVKTAEFRQIFTPQHTGWAKKLGHRLMTIILSNLNRFTNFLTGRFLGKFAVKCIVKIPLHLAYVATLPCETLMSAKQAIDDKLQGSVAAYLTCGGVVNNQIKKGFWCHRSPRNSTGVTPYLYAKCRWGGSKSATFDK